jgi:hypothetical protein
MIGFGLIALLLHRSGECVHSVDRRPEKSPRAGG